MLSGETANDAQDKRFFFTGKPRIDELGYSFLFRNYRPEKSKWQTADPLGYPDGWNCMAYCGNGVQFSIDSSGLVPNISDPEILALWTAHVELASLLALGESVHSDSWNFQGYLHWLQGTGNPVNLSWECFDNSQIYKLILDMAEIKEHFRIVNVASSMGIGTIKTITNSSPLITTDQGSHNAWISSYKMSVVSWDSITINRISKTKYSYTISAFMLCYDIADFNSGQSFGIAGITFYDDWFWEMQKKYNFGVDYEEYSYGYKFKIYSGTIKE